MVRQGQDAQTIGLPVGPDTSRIIAEIILSAVDGSFLDRYPKRKPTYLRHVDDYWIGEDTLEECERHLQNLRAALREFELDLNDLKTKIVLSNNTLGESWPSDFERMLKRSFGHRLVAKDYDPISTLGLIIEKANKENDDGMIRHAIRKIDENRLWDRDWETLEHFLAHCAVHFPHSFDYVARVVIWRIKTGKPFDKGLWKEVNLTFAQRASSLGKDSETLWSLWLMKELKTIVPSALSDSIIAHNKPLVMGFLAHMYSKGRTRDKGVGAKLAAAVIGNPYASSAWPLALELSHLDIPGVDFAAHGATETSLRTLHDSKKTLVQWDAMPAVFVGDDGEEVDEPSYAIEDFTSDYDDDGEASEDDMAGLDF